MTFGLQQFIDEKNYNEGNCFIIFSAIMIPVLFHCKYLLPYHPLGLISNIGMVNWNNTDSKLVNTTHKIKKI